MCVRVFGKMNNFHEEEEKIANLVSHVSQNEFEID